jgi:hypothetical protein
VVSAHSAAQIAMVIVLDRAGQFEHLNKNSRGKLLAFLEDIRTNPCAASPDIRFADFMKMYDACTKLLPEGIATPEHRDRLSRLNSLRNDWVHFGDHHSSVTVRLARLATLAGIKLLTELPLPSLDWLHENATDQTRHEVALSSLLRLLAVEEMDGTPSEENDEDRYTAP